MKKYLCATSYSPYRKGEVYKLDEEDSKVKVLVRLGYLEEVPMNYPIKVRKGGRDK
jgi:hypothetical protein